MHVKPGAILLLCSTMTYLTSAKIVRRLASGEASSGLHLDRLIFLGPSLQAQVNMLWMDNDQKTKHTSRRQAFDLIAPYVEDEVWSNSEFGRIFV